MTYLLPAPAGRLPEVVEPQTTVRIDPVSSSVDKILVEDPEGHEHTAAITPGAPRMAFGDTGIPGVYYVTQYAGSDIQAQEAFAVNLFSRDHHPHRQAGLRRLYLKLTSRRAGHPPPQLKSPDRSFGRS